MRLLIFGDSYSAFQGYIPADYSSYYGSEIFSSSIRSVLPDVKSVDEMWWHILIKKLNISQSWNDSWAGSSICYTGYNGTNCSKSSSFIYRYLQLKKQGFFENNKVDTVCVFGGTNDSWSDAPLGNAKFSYWQEKDLYNVLPAICYFMYILTTDLPDSRIIFIANCDIKEEIIKCINKAGDFFGVDVINLHDIDKKDGHPTVKGMWQIYNQIIKIM